MSRMIIPSNAVVIAVPEDFRNRDGGLYINTITIEGTKDHDKKLVIKHRPIYQNASPDKIVVPLRGSDTFKAWEEFEGADLEAQYKSNLIDLLDEQPKRQLQFHYKSASLYAFIREYFLENENGKRIIELIRRKNQQIYEKLERADAPKYDKIIRETAEYIKAKYKIITVEESGTMLYYDNGVYVPGAEIIIKKAAQAKFEYDMRNQLVNEIMGAIQRGSYVSEKEFDADFNIVNFEDCLYNIKTKEVLEHKPEYLSRNQKPINLLLAREEQHRRANNGSIYPRLYGKFLSEIVYPKQRRTMVELFAYTFYRTNPHELYVNQWGFGGNGKGVNMAILKALHGPKNVSNIPLRKLITDRFATADLTGKDVNVDDETSSGTVTDNTVLKKMTGNQPTYVQRKNKDPYETVLHSKFWFTCNQLPDVIDESDGRYRREITIIYPNTFVKNPTRPGERKEDPDIEDKIVKDELEMSRIANMCMDVLHRILFKQNKRVYTDIATVNERKKHLQIIKSPVRVFADQVIEHVFVDGNEKLYKDELYNEYLKFCKLYNIAPKDDTFLGVELVKILGIDRLTDKRDSKETLAPGATKKTRRRYWIGIKLKDKWVNQTTAKSIQKTIITEDDDEEDEDNNKQATGQA
jgi:phage/plasmid-associated DNA primase